MMVIERRSVLDQPYHCAIALAQRFPILIKTFLSLLPVLNLKTSDSFSPHYLVLRKTVIILPSNIFCMLQSTFTICNGALILFGWPSLSSGNKVHKREDVILLGHCCITSTHCHAWYKRYH